MATALGLGALALDLPLSAAEVGDGLVPPAVAYHVRPLRPSYRRIDEAINPP